MKKFSFIGIIFLALFLSASIADGSNQLRAGASDPAAILPLQLRLQAATFDPLTERAPRLDLRTLLPTTLLPTTSLQAAAARNEAPIPNNPLGIEPETSYHLVQFAIDSTIAGQTSNVTLVNGSVDPLWLTQLAALDAEPISYVPDNAYLVRIAPPDADKVLALPFVRWVGPYEPSYKLSLALAQTLSASNPPDAVDLYITAFSGEPLSMVETFIHKIGGQVRSADDALFGPLLAATLPTSALDALLRNPAISWVEPETPLVFTNSEARSVLHADELWDDLGYYGSGQIVAVVDSGLSTQGSLNADFDGRLRQTFSPAEMGPFYDNCLGKTTWTDLNGHGTHIAGSILGNGRNSGSDPSQHRYANSHAGIAPEAELVFIALGLDNSTQIHCLTLDGKFLSNGYDAGARIASNSWGNSDGGRYGTLARLVDEFIWTHPDYLVFFSAGNSGSGPSTVGSPATAKNVLAVGASENARPNWGSYADDPSSVIGFSSRGPTIDGRLKPDIVAPGTWILSTRAEQAPSNSFWGIEDQFYAYSGGTSMATPLAAGGAALLREWLTRDVGMTDPSAALLKAAILHGATPFNQANGINAIAPDFNSGWGRINLTDTVSARYLLLEDVTEGLETGKSVSFEIEIIGVDQIGTFVAAPPSGYIPSLDSGGVFTNTGTISNSVGSTEAISAFFTVEPAEFDSDPPLVVSAAALTARPNTTIVDLTQSPATGLPLDQHLIRNFPVPALLDDESDAFGSRATLDQLSSAAQPDAALQNLIGGGDFEEPKWQDEWQNVWIRSGDPVRTDQADEVINGSHSFRIGGGAVGNGLWYPLHFPAKVSESSDLELSLDLRVIGQDIASPQNGYDWFCVTLIDSAGAYIEPFSPQRPDCWPNDGDYSFSKKFSNNLDELAGRSGNLILYASSNGNAPHMKALVDDVRLTMRFAEASLESTPTLGEAGTTFLLTGANFQPSSVATLCYERCERDGTPSENQIAQVAVDGRGVVAFTLESDTTFAPGLYTVEAMDEVGTSAITTFTIVAAAAPTIVISPTAAVAGSMFRLTGSGFAQSDTNVEIYANGTRIGAAASSADGRISLRINTTESTRVGTYRIRVVDSARRSAKAEFTILAAARPDPVLTVSPSKAAAGSQFVFRGRNFDPNVAATLYLDNASAGSVMVDGVGALRFTLNSAVDATQGLHTLRAEQSTLVAAAVFEIMKPPTPSPTPSPTLISPTATAIPATPVPATSVPPTPTPDQVVVDPSERVTALDFTLVWTDPPAPQFAGSALINNLDLRVEGPAGTVYGWGGPQAGSAGMQPDTINNVERVRLVDPQPGLYVITVQGQRVDTIFGAQPFALIGTQEQVPIAESASAEPDSTSTLTPIPTLEPTATFTPSATFMSTVTAIPTVAASINTPMPLSTIVDSVDDQVIDDENRSGKDEDAGIVVEEAVQNGAEALLMTATPALTPGTVLLPTAVPTSEVRVLLPLVEN